MKYFQSGSRPRHYVFTSFWGPQYEVKTQWRGGNQTYIFRADRQYDVFDIHVFLKFIRYIFIRPIKIFTQGVPHNLTSQHQGCSKGCSIATCANDNANIKKMCGIKVFLKSKYKQWIVLFRKMYSLKIKQGVCELIFINRFQLT